MGEKSMVYETPIQTVLRSSKKHNTAISQSDIKTLQSVEIKQISIISCNAGIQSKYEEHQEERAKLNNYCSGCSIFKIADFG